MLKDEKYHKDVLIGDLNRRGLEKGDFAQYFFGEYKGYFPDYRVIDKLNGRLNGVSITIVLGSWCKDSQEQVPRFIKLLDMLQYDFHQLRMIGVDSRKMAYIFPLDDMKIEKVPTFIFYRDNREIGRITETPGKSLEKDMLRIIR